MTSYIPMVWQFDKDYPDTIPSDEELGLTKIAVKTHDGLAFMGTWDTHSSAVRNMDAIKTLMNTYGSTGITFIPWCVPNGISISREADLAASIGNLCGRIILDVEWDSNRRQYWLAGSQGIGPYMDNLRESFKGQVSLQYDSRNPNDIFLSRWLPYVDDLISMDYWTDFGRPAVDVLNVSSTVMDQLEKPYTFTLPGDSDIFPLLPHSKEEVFIWRRGTMSPQCVSMLQSNVSKPNNKTTEEKIADLYNEQVRQAVRMESIESRLTSLISYLKEVNV